VILDGLLTLLVLALAAARLSGANWYATHKPIGMRLLEGWPASWESIYFLAHLPTFLGDEPSRLGIAPVDYRTYVNLYLFTQVYGWIGSAYWSLAAIDVFFWSAGAVCTRHLARRLGASDSAALIGATLVAGSPVLISFMWHQDLHLANMASLPIGLWAAAALVQEHRSRLRLAASLAFLLLYLSTTYQYQWIVAPAALLLAAFHPRLGLRRGLIVMVGAVALFLIFTVVIQALLSIAGLGPQGNRLGAVNEPGALVSSRIVDAGAFGSVLAILPGPRHLTATAEAYHPIVFCAGLVGLALLGKRALALAALALVAPLGFMTLYPTPWVAMSGYPLVYIGAGVGCARVSTIAAALIHRVAPRQRFTTAMSLVATFLLATWLFSLTNLDLTGDPSFLLNWWGLYAHGQIH